MDRSLRVSALVYAVLGIGLWPVPLLGLLHVEAAAVVAAAAFFAAGLAAVRAFRGGAAFGEVLRGHLLLLAIPLVLLTVTVLWRPNCGYLAGLGFYVLFAVPSVCLAVGTAYALTGTRLRRPGLLLVLLGLVVGLGGVLFDLGLHPQFYTYSHVFGGVLGPIYDEELAVRPGLFAFRGLTVLWAAWAFLLGRWLRRSAMGEAERRHVVVAGAVVALALALGYGLRVPLGVNTTYAALDAALGGRYDGDGFVLHYDPEALAPADFAWIVDEHRYRIAQFEGTLGVTLGAPVHTYLYPDGAARAALMGSRDVGVSPVWLVRPQLHLLQDEFTAEHFGHELAHAFSRAFAAPPLRASPAVGLVEGFAVAIEPPDGLPSPTQQVAASMRLPLDDEAAGALAAGPAKAVAGALSPWGFWTGRGAVSYTTTGAFVRWLLDRYGPDKFATAYRSADFEAAYGLSADTLAARWEGELRRLPVSVEAESLAAWRFRQPSLFERRCPHWVPPSVRYTRAAVEAEEEGDAAVALGLYEKALDADARFVPALVGWTRRALATGVAPAAVVRRLEAAADSLAADPTEAPSPSLFLALGDAYRFARDSTRSSFAYDESEQALPPYAPLTLVAYRLRRALPLDALRVLFAAGLPEDRARRLEMSDDPAAQFFASLLWLEARAPDRALALAETLPRDDGRFEPFAVRVLLGYRSRLADRARDYARAEAYARAAGAAFEEAGEESRAALMADLSAKAAWLRRYGER